MPFAIETVVLQRCQMGGKYSRLPDGTKILEIYFLHFWMPFVIKTVFCNWKTSCFRFFFFWKLLNVARWDEKLLNVARWDEKLLKVARWDENFGN